MRPAQWRGLPAASVGAMTRAKMAQAAAAEESGDFGGVGAASLVFGQEQRVGERLHHHGHERQAEEREKQEATAGGGCVGTLRLQPGPPELALLAWLGVALCAVVSACSNR